jgi:lysozyme family protein
MTSVAKHLDALIDREGGFTDHPADRGGPTNWGITERVARAYGYHGRMQDLPRSVAVSIYLERYWTQPRFDQVAEFAPLIAEELADTGVNMGPATASKFLQRALNVLNRETKIYPDIEVDGQIGRLTIAALRAFLAERGKDGIIVLLRMLDAQQSVRYLEIAERDPHQEAFVFGWQLNRVGGVWRLTP